MLKSLPYRICSRCVMDTTDVEITFDQDGVCNHCTEFENVTRKRWFPNEQGARRLAKSIDEMKSAGKGREYDCILGLSGGIDSSYLALKAKDWNLRPLVVHVDAGWNAELAVSNIEAIVKHCNYDLHTHVVDWEEMRDLQLAFLRAGVPNQDVPQDHVFFASLYNFAMKHGIRHVLSGGNIATESIFPLTWQASAMDAINLKAIHRAYGERPLKTYSLVSFFDYYIGYPYLKGMRVLRPLDNMPYNKELAVAELEEKIGWRSYGRKHGESLFTKLFQNHFLPMKFGYDKRRPHYASLIVSGQMTREQALKSLEEPLYDPTELEVDIAYFCKKLRITRAQFEKFISDPPRRHEDFATWKHRYAILKAAQSIYQKVTGHRMSYG